MATSTTVGTVKSQLVTSLSAHASLSSVDVSYTWRPWGDSDQVFLGDVEGDVEIPTLKSGRKNRHEEYTVDVIMRAVDNDGTPQGGASVETRALTFLAALDDVLADDVQIDGVTAIQWARVGGFSSRMVPQDKGWGCQISVQVEVEARLQ